MILRSLTLPATITLLSTLILSFQATSQCEATATASEYEIYCGESVDLTAFGQSSGTVVLSEDFNSGGFGTGWGSTPGATSFTNPCSPGGVDGTPHAWMDNNTSVPRTLESSPYDLTAATAGVTICFDLLFASQGDAAPCEGPDEPDEGVYLEYSTDGGTTWQTIHYFDPNGGNDPQLTNWNNWCFQVPPGAITNNTIFRWHQTADSGADYDHWGIDNVEIYQNDVNAELVWLHDGYSYGVGNPGGTNPNSVSPTSTTTYTVELTTGSGTTCTDDVTITVLDPVIDANINLNPSTICPGDCADITGDAAWVLDPGGIETYENNQLEIVATGSAAVNINIQDLNMNTIDPGSIQEICVNDFNYTGTEVCSNFGGCNCNGTQINLGATCNIDASSFNITVSTPDGCEITLVPSSTITTTGIQDMCFVPTGGAPISSGSGSYTGQFDPTDPFSALDGCDANGVWTLEFNTGSGGLGLGAGSLTGWNITFDDPPIEQPVNATWTPGTDLSSTNTINTQACPTTTTTYTIELDNGVAGCATYTEDFTVTVDPCTGCTPPNTVINDPLTACDPNSVGLNTAIDATSDPANYSFYNSQTDAQNATNSISSTVTSSGSYWVRAEDPSDPTCFDVYEIQVIVTTVTYNASITDENCGNVDGEIDLTANGGTTPYTYSIDNGSTTQGNGTFSNISAGSYDIVITDDNGCEVTGTETVGNIGGPTITSITQTDPTCAGDCDGSLEVVVTGGTAPYSYQWLDNGGNPVGPDAAIINGLCADDYSVEVTDGGGSGCTVTDNTTLTDPPLEDPTFTFNDFCEGSANAPTITGDAGGSFAFNPVPTDGATIDAATGEISNGVNGATYTVEYTTGGPCPESSTETVSVTGFTFSNTVVDENCGNLDGEISLTPNGGTAPYTYSIDNGNTTQGNGTFTGLSAGVYNIVITDDVGCTATGQVSVANIGGPTIDQMNVIDPSCPGACDGEVEVIVSGGTPPYTYNWTDGGGNPVGGNTATITGLCADDYSVEVADAAATCPVSSTSTLTDPAPDDASFSLTDFCEGTTNSASGIATPGGTFAFNPAPGDGATIDASTGEVSNGVGGTTYTIEYTTPGACPETSTETVDVIAAPQFTVSGTNPGCGATDGEITIEGLQANTAYDLTYDDNGTVVGPQNITTNASGEIILNGLPAGSYADFEITLNGCTTIDNSVIDLVQAGAPNVTAPNDVEVCEGADIVLTANNPDGATISWDNGVTDGVAFSGTTVGTTTYTVSGDLNGCTVTDQVDVTVNPLPIVDAGADQSICEGESITLSGNGAQSYQWDNGVVDGTSFIPGSTSTYTVTGTDANGCQNTDQVTVTIETAPTVTFNGDVLSGCAPHTVNFTNTTADGVNCNWDFGDGTSAQGCAGVTHTYQNSGLYTVTLTVENASGCIGTETLTNYIEVTGPPTADFTADPMVTDINDTEVNFTNESSGGTDFTWDFGDGSGGANTYDATHIFPDDESGEYVVTLVASNGPDCADTARLLIKIEDEIIFYVPNTFTPDGDEFNQTFQPVFTSGYDPQDFQMLIFNRWGEVIFETHNAAIGWDGTYNGKYVKDGTYVWTIEFQETMSDKRHYHQGHVNMLK